MGFTNDNLEELYRTNDYFKKPAAERYDDFRAVDPFPYIHDSLLNSADVVKYILATGMIEPFDLKNLTGATYTCDFSGRYIYWDNEKIQQTKILSENEELTIRSNSITYLEINPIFRIPTYMVLRFNLQVRNVYKGLLLGTGPIVDPGFVGRLFIPLHNLTSNEYIIKKNATLISVEFTKLSKTKERALLRTDPRKKIVDGFNFSGLSYIPEINDPNRTFDEYINKALQGKPDFYKKDMQSVYVNSSMQALKQDTDKTIKEMSKTKSDVEEALNKAEHRESFLRNLFVLTVVGMMISIVSLLIGAGWYFIKATELSDATKQIQRQQDLFEKEKSSYQQTIDKLMFRVEILEKIISINPVN